MQKQTQRRLIWILIAGGVLLCFGAILRFHFGSIGSVPTFPLPVPRRCQPLSIPERLPSAGLQWSRAHYPEQYEDANTRAVEMSAIEVAGDEEFLQEQRYMDIGGAAFSREFISRFSYSDDTPWHPEVRVSYLKRGETFIGRLEAEGLKPNFAYQLKLRGIFSDRDAFERIGYLGRWRLPGWGTNATDRQYEDYEAKSEVESYLFFDYFVTDGRGRVEKEFYADSTLHVLYNSTWQRDPRARDTHPRVFERKAVEDWIYTNPDVGLRPQRIYAQSEANSPSAGRRPPIREAFLPPGRYRAELVLTEESFHGFGDAGYWATVMSAPVKFEVVEKPRPHAEWRGGTEVRRFSLERTTHQDLKVDSLDDTMLTGRATNRFPRIVFEKPVEDLPPGRYVLKCDVLVGKYHCWAVGIRHRDDERGMPLYMVHSRKCRGWRTFRVEISSAVAGGGGRLTIDPAHQEGPIGVRNVALLRVESPGPREKDPR